MTLLSTQPAPLASCRFMLILLWHLEPCFSTFPSLLSPMRKHSIQSLHKILIPETNYVSVYVLYTYMSIIPKNVRLFLLPMTNFPPLKGDTMSTENVCPVLAYPLCCWINKWLMTPVLPGLTWYPTRGLIKGTASGRCPWIQVIWISETLFRSLKASLSQQKAVPFSQKAEPPVLVG